MLETVFQNPGMTIALALAGGMAAQSLAHHLRIPGIVVLLALGVLLGPDGLNVVRPDILGQALPVLTGFAVAIILFEGGMNLKLFRLRREQKPIRRLLTITAPITVVGGTLAVRGLMHWDWRTSILFGALVMVTGPTVINPLLRRLSVKRNVAVILEAEGVLIDAVGAVLAIVALEVALSPMDASPGKVALLIGSRLGFGALAGVAGGFLLAGLMRQRFLPEGMENVFTLSFVVALFQISNAGMHESGVAAVTAAGIVMGNIKTPARRELAEFKEQLTLMLIGLLFVLLAADVRLSDLRLLGTGGLYVVLALIVIVRPLAVALGMVGTRLKKSERLFLGWIGPRGIVAAAVASLFAARLQAYGFDAGRDLRAMVFLVITATVLWAGFTGGLAARVLKLRRTKDNGWVVLGANELARALSVLLRKGGHEVVSIDANPNMAMAAERDCTRVMFANGLQARTLLRAEIDIRMGALSITPNPEVNLLFIQNARREARRLALFLAIDDTMGGVTPKMAHAQTGQVLFAGPADVNKWCARLARQEALLARFVFAPDKEQEQNNKKSNGKSATAAGALIPKDASLVALTHERKGRVMPLGDRTRISRGDEVALLVKENQMERAAAKMAALGWSMSSGHSPEPLSLSQCVIDPEAMMRMKQERESG